MSELEPSESTDLDAFYETLPPQHSTVFYLDAARSEVNTRIWYWQQQVLRSHEGVNSFMTILDNFHEEDL